MKISPARVAAFDVLLRIERDGAYSSVLLPAHESTLRDVDRSLCHELVLGTLRRQIYLDRAIDQFSNGKRLDVGVRIAVRMGLYQSLFLDRVPDYSSVNDSVNLVQTAGKTSAKGFVNAILRRATREKPNLLFADDIDRISVETSHPKWLIEKWIDEFGADEAEALAAANNRIAEYAFRSITGAPVAIKNARPSQYVEGCFLAERFDPGTTNDAEGNEVYFQDEGSQMVAASVRVPSGGRFLDVCAAPGGKTGLIAQRSAASGIMVVAGDLHSARLDMLSQNCRRQGVQRVQLVQYDAVDALPFTEKSFDVVLVDAPCSGTGTIRHNPELRYLLKEADIPDMAEKQLSILRNASNLVKGGGSVLYSTCSLEVEENEMVCERFLEKNPDFSVVRPAVDGRFITDRGFARTFPQRDAMDGFFIADLRRN